MRPLLPRCRAAAVRFVRQLCAACGSCALPPCLWAATCRLARDLLQIRTQCSIVHEICSVQCAAGPPCGRRGACLFDIF